MIHISSGTTPHQQENKTWKLYINPQYYSVYDSDDFLNELIEYLDNHYNLDKLK